MLTQKNCLDLFDYSDGILIRKSCPSRPARVGVRIEGKIYEIHRIIFLMHHGYLPSEVDHIDRDRTNNRIENLREVTRSQNMMNTAGWSRGTSSYKGVSWHKQSRKWQAAIRIDGKAVTFGRFNTELEAAECYNLAAKTHHNQYYYQG